MHYNDVFLFIFHHVYGLIEMFVRVRLSFSAETINQTNFRALRIETAIAPPVLINHCN